MPRPESDDRVTLGKVLRAHGVHGSVVVASDPSVHEAFAEGLACRLDGGREPSTEPRCLTVVSVSPHPHGLRLRFNGVVSREQAEALAGGLITVARSALPRAGEDRYYDFEIIGLQAVDSDERRVGEVVDIISTGANDVYVIRGDQGELLVPATGHGVLEVDVGTGRIVIDPRAAVES